MKTLLTGVIAAAAAIVLHAGAVSADEVADILAKADENLTKVKDLTYDADMKVMRDGKVIKTIKFIAKLKGLKKRLVRFTAPGDVRGMAILTTEEGLMYVYMPAYKRVRRVASHVENQGFMGSDISPDEMSSAAWSVDWKGKILHDKEKVWVLELRPKAGLETSYSKQIITVDKSFGGVVKVKSFNKKGKLVKTQVRTEVKSFGPIKMPTKFVYTDELTGSKTILTFHGCKVNQGIPDSAFSKRALMRAR
jgi:outer membrane lipoprotein-sorting protein